MTSSSQERSTRPISIRYRCAGSSPSWQRSLATGVDPDSMGRTAEAVNALDELRKTHPLAPTLPLIRRLLVEDAVDAGVVAAITAADGTLLWVEGDRLAMRKAEAMNFVPGTDWSENIAGPTPPAPPRAGPRGADPRIRALLPHRASLELHRGARARPRHRGCCWAPSISPADLAWPRRRPWRWSGPPPSPWKISSRCCAYHHPRAAQPGPGCGRPQAVGTRRRPAALAGGLGFHHAHRQACRHPGAADPSSRRTERRPSGDAAR